MIINKRKIKAWYRKYIDEDKLEFKRYKTYICQYYTMKKLNLRVF